MTFVPNSQKTRKIILTDVDGVLINWQAGLPFFLKTHNFMVNEAVLDNILTDKWLKPEEMFKTHDGKSISADMAIELFKQYNQSDFIRTTPAYLDALDVVNRLKQDYDFIAVSALSDSKIAWANRMFNLDCLFPEAFKQLYLTTSFSSKAEAFDTIIDKYGIENILCYIDDLPSHVNDFMTSCDKVNGSNPMVIQMNRRAQLPHSLAVNVSDWVSVHANIAYLATRNLNYEVLS